MRLVFATVIFHILCIITFTSIYNYLSYSIFSNFEKNRPQNILDWISLSVTIQSGVGYSEHYPNSNAAKCCTIVQQSLLIFVNVFMIYFIVILDKERNIISRLFQ